jgi:hypothetical protein
MKRRALGNARTNQAVPPDKTAKRPSVSWLCTIGECGPAHEALVSARGKKSPIGNRKPTELELYDLARFRGGGEEDLTEEEKYLRMVSALCLVFTQLHSLTAQQTPICVPGMITHVQRDILIF